LFLPVVSAQIKNHERKPQMSKKKVYAIITVAVAIYAGLLLTAVVAGRHATPATAYTTADVVSVCLRGNINEARACISAGKELVRLRQDMARNLWLQEALTSSMRELEEARKALMGWEESTSVPRPQSGREIIMEVRGYYPYE
jgi:hypothetical protein